MLKYNIASQEGATTSVTVFASDGSMCVATREHPSFQAIVDALRLQSSDSRENEDFVVGLFDVGAGIMRQVAQYERLSERISVAKGSLLFDGDLATGGLENAILKLHAAGAGWQPFVAFMDKIATNPNPHSREHLFRWMQQHNFQIEPDGDLIAYKGVKVDGKSDHSGTAFVNGVKVVGRIPNEPGTIIEMPRSDVAFDPAVACHTGLHVGNWRHASTFIQTPGARILRVKINPRDVVSVPVDSNNEKMRVCRYKVVDRVAGEANDVVAITDARIAKVVGDIEGAEKAADPKRETLGKVARALRKAAAKPAKQVSRKPQKKATAKAKPKPTPTERVFPQFYDQFTRADFEACGVRELRWLAGKDQWNIGNWSKRDAKKATLIDALIKMQRRLNRELEATAK